MTITKHWTGNVFGTNVGNLFVEFAGEDDGLTGTLRFNDTAYGLVVYTISGQFDGSELILAGEPPAPEADGVPLGKLTASARLRPNGSMEGEWETDQGTAGTFVLFPHERNDGIAPNTATPPQLHTARYYFGAIEINREQIIAAAEELRKDFTRGTVVITFSGETEQSRFLDDFKSLNISAKRLNVIKIVAQEPEVSGINRVASIHFGPQFNELMTQSANEAWALGKLETLKRELRQFERTYATNIKRLMGIGINELLLAWAIVYMPSLSNLRERIVFMAATLGLIWIVNRIHAKYLPHAAIYVTTKPTGLFALIGPHVVSWVISATAAIVAALISIYLQEWLQTTTLPVPPG